MSDQTRSEWRPSNVKDLGTLVVLTENDYLSELQRFTSGFERQEFAFNDEPLIKLYFQDVPFYFVIENERRLLDFSFAWVPERIKNLFVGRCGGDDCSASQECVRPGCVCKQSIITGRRKCR